MPKQIFKSAVVIAMPVGRSRRERESGKADHEGYEPFECRHHEFRRTGNKICYRDLHAVFAKFHLRSKPPPNRKNIFSNARDALSIGVD